MKRIFQLMVCAVAVSAIVSGCATTSQTAGGQGRFKGPVGLQLYSLRDQFKTDVPGTLDKVKAFGVRHAELAGTYGLSPEKFRQELLARGIEPVSGHFPFERFRDDVEGIAREAKALGLKYVGCAWIPHEGEFNEKVCREAIGVFNRAGEAVAKHGLKFFYHNHGYEFHPHSDGTLFDLMMKETNPRFVSYEMDTFWIVHPGQDPAKLLAKYGPRWELMHIKDMKKGTPTGILTGRSEVTNDVTLGTGQIDLAATLRAAKKAGVKWYFIEDESPTVEQQLPQSLKYLEQVSF
jgi:sugar phosphate isomerase/epimerase